MNKQRFQTLIRMAKTFQNVDSDRSEFWSGYQRGLRKLFHGENFGTAEEHEKLLNCADGDYRKQLQTGYRAGFYADELPKLTTVHPTSSYGIPVFVDAHNQVMDYSTGIRRIRNLLALSTLDLAEIAAVSSRTVEGWEQGRPMAKPALMLIQKFLII